jgi:hypothetical protein
MMNALSLFQHTLFQARRNKSATVDGPWFNTMKGEAISQK